MSARAGKGQNRKAKRPAEKPVFYEMRLFVAGEEPNSVLAKASLTRICSAHLEGHCHVEIVDVLKDFRPALQENILVTPALVIHRGQARSVVFGNLTNVDRVLTALNIGSESS